MDERNELDLKALMQRFDAGDRSQDLLLQLNRAAYDAFHAPWETHPPQEELSAPFRTKLLQGRLPMDQDDESADDSDDSEDLIVPPAIRQGRQGKSPTPPHSEGNGVSATGPLETLDSAMEYMGRLGYHAPGRGLVVDLAYDPRADFQSQFTFRADWEGQTLQVISRSDLPLSGLSEQELRRICNAYNQRETGLEAKIYRPQDGSRPRLRLITTIPFGLTRSFQALVNHLADLFRKDLQFWRQVQRHRPM